MRTSRARRRQRRRVCTELSAFRSSAPTSVLGVIEFFSRQAQEPDAGLLDMMASAGSQIGLFIESRQAEEELRRSAALRGSMLESTLDCVIAMDHEGRIIEFNPAAEKTFGYSARGRDRGRDGRARDPTAAA